VGFDGQTDIARFEKAVAGMMTTTAHVKNIISLLPFIIIHGHGLSTTTAAAAATTPLSVSTSSLVIQSTAALALSQFTIWLSSGDAKFESVGQTIGAIASELFGSLATFRSRTAL
jgi:hypothetical protein